MVLVWKVFLSVFNVFIFGFSKICLLSKKWHWRKVLTCVHLNTFLSKRFHQCFYLFLLLLLLPSISAFLSLLYSMTFHKNLCFSQKKIMCLLLSTIEAVQFESEDYMICLLVLLDGKHCHCSSPCEILLNSTRFPTKISKKKRSFMIKLTQRTSNILNLGDCYNFKIIYQKTTRVLSLGQKRTKVTVEFGPLPLTLWSRKLALWTKNPVTRTTSNSKTQQMIKNQPRLVSVMKGWSVELEHWTNNPQTSDRRSSRRQTLFLLNSQQPIISGSRGHIKS